MLVPSNIDAKFQALLKCDIPSKRAGLSALRPRKSPTRFHEDPDKESLDYGYQYPDSILAIISSLRFDCFASSPNPKIGDRLVSKNYKGFPGRLSAPRSLSSLVTLPVGTPSTAKQRRTNRA